MRKANNALYRLLPLFTQPGANAPDMCPHFYIPRIKILIKIRRAPLDAAGAYGTAKELRHPCLQAAYLLVLGSDDPRDLRGCFETGERHRQISRSDYLVQVI